jgi:hypothetical protein
MLSFRVPAGAAIDSVRNLSGVYCRKKEGFLTSFGVTVIKKFDNLIMWIVTRSIIHGLF